MALPPLSLLQDMLTYRRPSRTDQTLFTDRYLKPVFGPPDRHGNFYLHLPGQDNLAFCAHVDTVHRSTGRTTVIHDRKNHIFRTPHQSTQCLGADDTTGIWLILSLIAARKPGHYFVFADEEVGALGSQAFLEDNPDLFDPIDFMIAFDRYGTKSVITCQMGYRTASDEFAHQFAALLPDLNLAPDPHGSFTDSETFTAHVSECTNISVGYYHQHSADEIQDTQYLQTLRKQLIKADFTSLTAHRPLSTPAPTPIFNRRRPQSLENLIEEYPYLVAQFIEAYQMDEDLRQFISEEEYL